MPETIVAPRLAPGDLVRVVAPARSRAMVLEFDHTDVIDARFAELGLRLDFGAHVDERDVFDSSSIASRVADLHAAWADPEVAAILTVIGGFNSNELLPYLDWELIRNNPKIFCGYSDITVLQNAILATTGLVTYSGPNWSSFGMRDHFERTLRWFADVMFDRGPWEIEAAETWTDDCWFLDQADRTSIDNEGWWGLADGEATGRIVGGNLCTLNLLQGTPWMPSLTGAVVFVEDDERSDVVTFARDLTSLLQQPDADQITGLLIGRFQRASRIERKILAEIVARQPALEGRPVLANVDFGHTNPSFTFPVGGVASLAVGPTPHLRIAEAGDGQAPATA